MIAARTGSDATNALVALVLFAQSPGSLRPRFSVEDFLIGIGIYLFVVSLTLP